MIRSKRIAAILGVLALGISGCGTQHHSTSSRSCVPPVGAGVTGACAPHHPSTGFSLPPRARLIPDVSEFQGCALHSEAIVRVYEAGTNRQDRNAACHFAELRRLHAWSAAYFFARPPGFAHAPSCTAQADTAVRIALSLGVTGPIVDDAEVPLPRGFVRCVKAEIERRGLPAVEYTCPGCGDERAGVVWIASYPTRPPGTWVAHQFSDSFPCRGVTGDCSIDEGITRITRAKPLTPKQKSARRRQLAKLLGAFDARRNPSGHNCQNPPFRHAYPSARFNKACAVWAREVRNGG
jgi:hypothetical protein